MININLHRESEKTNLSGFKCFHSNASSHFTNNLFREFIIFTSFSHLNFSHQNVESWIVRFCLFMWRLLFNLSLLVPYSRFPLHFCISFLIFNWWFRLVFVEISGNSLPTKFNVFFRLNLAQIHGDKTNPRNPQSRIESTRVSIRM